jgi:hypothetical protein
MKKLILAIMLMISAMSFGQIKATDVKPKADIACKDGAKRWVIVNALLKAGINRRGVSGSFIHADCDPTKPANVIWTY